jgi:hypothetical protein
MNDDGREREKKNNDILMPASQSDLRVKEINESKYYSEFEIKFLCKRKK